MTEKGNRKNVNMREQLYVYGNTIRHGKEQIGKKDPADFSIQKSKVSRQTRRNQRRAMKLGFGYVSFFGTAVVIALLVCFQYIGIQSDVSKKSRTIESLRSEVSDLREANVSEYNYITNSMTLETIRERAEELGMVYADPSQVITYQAPGDDTIKKYKNIPESGVLEK